MEKKDEQQQQMDAAQIEQRDRLMVGMYGGDVEDGMRLRTNISSGLCGTPTVNFDVDPVLSYGLISA